MTGDVLVLSRNDVRRLLPMRECTELMDRALRTLASGRAVQPLRSAMWLPDRRGLLGLMPGYLQEPDALGVKVITVYPGNHGTEFDSHQGAVLLFDTAHGSLLAVMDGSEITRIRTAAASAVATRCLAREDSSILALIGTGVQADSHLEAIPLVRPISEVRIWSRDRKNVEQFVARHPATAGPSLIPCATAEEAVKDADIVCTVTGAAEPVLERRWLKAGVHINAVGACTPRARELPGDLIAESRLFTDRRESCANESGDFRIPVEEGLITEEHLAGELGDVLTGAITGRQNDDEITVFNSLGIAIEDMAVARYLYERARREGAGQNVVIGGTRDHRA